MFGLILFSVFNWWKLETSKFVIVVFIGLQKLKTFALKILRWTNSIVLERLKGFSKGLGQAILPKN